MKRKLKRLLALLLAFTMLLSYIPGIDTSAAVKPKLNKTSVTLKVGKSTTLKLNGYKGKIVWTSNKKSVAIVSKKGKVTAKKTGRAKVTAKAGRKKYVCKVKVVSKTKMKLTTTVATSTTQATTTEGATTTQATTTQVTTTAETVTPEEAKDPKKVTRIEWVKSLLKTVDADEVDDTKTTLDVYTYEDVNDKEDQLLLINAIEDGILKYENGKFYPDKYADREFVAATAVRAAGFLDTSCGVGLKCEDQTELTTANEDDVAIRNEMLSLIDGKFEPKKDISLDEKEQCLTKVKTLWEDLNKPFEEVQNFTYKENVVADDLEKVTDYTVSEDEIGEYDVVIPSEKEISAIKEDNIIMLPENEEFPAGFVCKVETTEKTSVGYEIHGVPVDDMSQVFKDVDYSGTVKDIGDIKFDENVTVLDNNKSLKSKKSPISTNVSSSKDGWDVKATVNVMYSDSLEVKKSDLVLHVNKPEVSCHIELKDGKFEGVRFRIVNGISADLDFDGTATSGDIPIATTTIPIGKGFSADVTLSAFINAEGEISYHANITQENNAVINKTNILAPQIDVAKPVYSGEFKAEAKLEVGLEPKLELKWGIYVKKFDLRKNIIDVSIPVSIVFSYTFRHLSTGEVGDPNNFTKLGCIDYKKDFIVKLTASKDPACLVSELAGKFKDDFEGFELELKNATLEHKHKEAKNDEEYKETPEASCMIDKYVHDEKGNPITYAKVDLYNYTLENFDSENLKLETKIKGPVSYEWTPGSKVKLPDVLGDEMPAFEYVTDYYTVTVTRKDGTSETYEVKPLGDVNDKYSEWLDTTVSGKRSLSDFYKGGDLTDLLWKFFGYVKDPTSTYGEEKED